MSHEALEVLALLLGIVCLGLWAHAGILRKQRDYYRLRGELLRRAAWGEDPKLIKYALDSQPTPGSIRDPVKYSFGRNPANTEVEAQADRLIASARMVYPDAEKIERRVL